MELLIAIESGLLWNFLLFTQCVWYLWFVNTYYLNNLQNQYLRISFWVILGSTCILRFCLWNRPFCYLLRFSRQAMVADDILPRRCWKMHHQLHIQFKGLKFWCSLMEWSLTKMVHFKTIKLFIRINYSFNSIKWNFKRAESSWNQIISINRDVVFHLFAQWPVYNP